jgi:CheY-like chemotaxis protein
VLTAVTEAGSGMEALEILRQHPPGTFSLVLTVCMHGSLIDACLRSSLQHKVRTKGF